MENPEVRGKSGGSSSINLIVSKAQIFVNENDIFSMMEDFAGRENGNDQNVILWILHSNAYSTYHDPTFLFPLHAWPF